MTDAELGASIRAIAKEAFEYGMRRLKTEWLAFGPLPETTPNAQPTGSGGNGNGRREVECDECGSPMKWKESSNPKYPGRYWCTEYGCKGKPVGAASGARR